MYEIKTTFKQEVQTDNLLFLNLQIVEVTCGNLS